RPVRSPRAEVRPRRPRPARARAGPVRTADRHAADRPGGGAHQGRAGDADHHPGLPQRALSMNRRLRLRPARRLPGDRDGATAIEIALIAPVMILLYFGLVEFSQSFMAQRRASHAASVVSDLVAQSERINRAGIDAIYAVGGLIMRPFPAAELSIRTTSISVDARGVATIEWSHGNGKARSEEHTSEL